MRCTVLARTGSRCTAIIVLVAIGCALVVCGGCRLPRDERSRPGGARPPGIRLSRRFREATMPEEGSSHLEWYDLFAKGVTPEEVTAAKWYARRYQDMSAYVPLMALWRHAVEEWIAVDPGGRAEILCKALAEMRWLNDFAVLHPDRSDLGPSGVALVMTGQEAIPYLAGLLTDSSPGRLTGSKTAMDAKAYQWRRNDYAYYLIHRIAGKNVELAPEPDGRDGAIETLRGQIQDGRFSVAWKQPRGCGSYETGPSEPNGVSPKVLVAIRQSRAGVPLWRSRVYRDGLSSSQAEQARKYAGSHADASSYILLMTLRKHVPAMYKRIGIKTKCRILACALGNVMFVDSFWSLEPSSPADAPAAAAVMELGEAIVPHLSDQPWSNRPAFFRRSKGGASIGVFENSRGDLAKRLIRQIEEHGSAEENEKP